jgi:hypothetical protein
MTTMEKIALGLFTIAPAFYLLIVMTGIVAVDLKTRDSLHDAAMLATLVLGIFYVINVFRNPLVLREKRVLWAVLLVFAGFISQIIYFWIYIWRQPPKLSVQ